MSIELPPDYANTEIILQIVGCKVCEFRGLAVYEEARRVSLAIESWQHIGYWVSPDAVDSVSSAIRSCPEPLNPRCQCEAHTNLGKKDVSGTWRGLLEMKSAHTFMMRLYQE